MKVGSRVTESFKQRSNMIKFALSWRSENGLEKVRLQNLSGGDGNIAGEKMVA